MHKARLLQPCSPGAPPTPMTGRYNFRRAWRPTPGQGPLHVAHVVLEALLLDCEVTLPCQLCLDRCCQSGNVLLRCNDFRMVGLAVLFLLLGGHQLLQNANDLAALWCVPLTGTARQERKQRGAIIIGNPCSWCFPAKRPRQQKSRHGYSRRLPALVLNHF